MERRRGGVGPSLWASETAGDLSVLPPSTLPLVPSSSSHPDIARPRIENSVSDLWRSDEMINEIMQERTPLLDAIDQRVSIHAAIERVGRGSSEERISRSGDMAWARDPGAKGAWNGVQVCPS